MSKTKAIIFDLYGVLGLNGWQSFKLRHFADRPADWEELKLLGQKVDTGQADQSELVSAVSKATGESEEDIRFQFEHTIPNTDLLKYIAEELRSKYKLGLLSNASRDVLGDIFSTEQLSLFDAALSSFIVGLTKPDPRMFLMICQKLGVSPEECIMVDDQQRHLDAAKKIGMNTVLYRTVNHTIKDLAEAVEV